MSATETNQSKKNSICEEDLLKFVSGTDNISAENSLELIELATKFIKSDGEFGAKLVINDIYFSKQINPEKRDALNNLWNSIFPILKAVEIKIPELLERIANDLNENTNDDEGNKPDCQLLCNVSEIGSLKIVKYLYETCHANVETKDECGKTPINIASSNGYLEIVKYLYELCHANIETKDIDGHTPFDNASSNSHTEIVKYLYEICHADVETCHADVEIKDNNGHIPLDNAPLHHQNRNIDYLYEISNNQIVSNYLEKEYFSKKYKDLLEEKRDLFKDDFDIKKAEVEYCEKLRENFNFINECSFLNYCMENYYEPKDVKRGEEEAKVPQKTPPHLLTVFKTDLHGLTKRGVKQAILRLCANAKQDRDYTITFPFTKADNEDFRNKIKEQIESVLTAIGKSSASHYDKEKDAIILELKGCEVIQPK